MDDISKIATYSMLFLLLLFLALFMMFDTAWGKREFGDKRWYIGEKKWFRFILSGIAFLIAIAEAFSGDGEWLSKLITVVWFVSGLVELVFAIIRVFRRKND